MSRKGAGSISVYIGEGPHKGQEFVVSSDLNANRIRLPMIHSGHELFFKDFDTVEPSLQFVDYEPRPIFGPDGKAILPVTYIPCDRTLWSQLW